MVKAVMVLLVVALAGIAGTSCSGGVIGGGCDEDSHCVDNTAWNCEHVRNQVGSSMRPYDCAQEGKSCVVRDNYAACE